MVQHKKEKINQKILTCALNEFALKGYQKTKISDIARNAGIATGNIYHYYKGKKALFQCILPESFLNTLLEITSDKVSALTGVEHIDSLPSDSEFQIISDRMLDFIIENRLKMIIIINGLDQSPYHGFRDSILTHVHSLAVRYYQSLKPGFTITESQSFNLLTAYKYFFHSLSDILLEYSDPTLLRESLNTQIRYHQGGLHTIFEEPFKK